MNRKIVDVEDSLRRGEIRYISAPMVRYSKLEFRTLLRKYGCQLCFTPMIVADSFVQSVKARHNEFTTDTGDTPLVVQFASNNVSDIVDACTLVSPYCDGVDINCGCPQSWAICKGYGSHLMSRPDLIKEESLNLRNRLSKPLSISIKIRLHSDIRKTVELCRAVESAGVSFLTVHGRTVKQRKEPVDSEAIKTLSQSVRVPVIANGDVKNLKQLDHMLTSTLASGVMVGRGVLCNPGMFLGYETTPSSCITDWLDICSSSDSIHFMTFHHHLAFMTEKMMTPKQKAIFNNIKRSEDVLKFLESEYNVKLEEREARVRKNLRLDVEYPDILTSGKYFESFAKQSSPHNLYHSEDYLDGSCLPF